MSVGAAVGERSARPVATDAEDAQDCCARLREQLEALELRLRKSEDRRRAMIHIMGDMNEANRRLADQRKAMLHILSDLHETSLEMQRREQELREKQEQLVQAAKLATLGELTTGVAHELNNPLNNIGLFVGNVIDRVDLGRQEREPVLRDLSRAMQQVRKANEIISHLRTFGRAAPPRRERVEVNRVIEQALSLISEQLRLREIDVRLDLANDDPVVMGSPIQLEQVVMNLLTNSRDALADSAHKAIVMRSLVESDRVKLAIGDTGPGIPPELEHRIFDPFFTTKEVGAGTGLGLSITYGIIQDHEGSIAVDNRPGEGVTFVIDLPLAADHASEVAV
jgi:C4-dicarboxylate-specific signal transduction histidine kinase